MISIAQIKERIVARHKNTIDRLEREIDATLEREWEKGNHYKIRFTIEEKVPREVIDHLRSLYSGENKWSVELRASRNDTNYDTLEFSPYSRPTSSEL